MGFIVEKEFECKGFKCVVIFGDHGTRCGYVAVPEGHAVYSKGYDDLYDTSLHDVHGGLTYAGSGGHPIGENTDKLWWLGFDCAHCGDGKDLEKFKEHFPNMYKMYSGAGLFSAFDGETIKTLEYVEKECTALAIMLHKMES